MSRRLRFAALLPLTLLLSFVPLASAYGRETAAARTTVLDLERQYQADQVEPPRGIRSAGLGSLSRSAAAVGRGLACTPGEVRFRVARSPREGRVPAAAERSARPARGNGPGQEAAGRDRAAAAVPHDDPRFGNGPPALGSLRRSGGGHQGRRSGRRRQASSRAPAQAGRQAGFRGGRPPRGGDRARVAGAC